LETEDKVGQGSIWAEAPFHREREKGTPDSQAAIKALSSMMVLECLGKLNDLGRNNKVTLLWVPGHVGVEDNEQADTLEPESFCGLGKAYVQEVLKKN